ncbi:hypothetical protein NLG97_g8042 [Lecanicillium saksenae]|uniref:Uncharacterized protein n=1 Tax=Lecanicillium saksenae TaxID=468837 RepID=A0ACC1QNX4_9HYPO|nr:hypothetical protein NLG97_g8042 [Lecanicillium saksenae]
MTYPSGFSMPGAFHNDITVTTASQPLIFRPPVSSPSPSGSAFLDNTPKRKRVRGGTPAAADDAPASASLFGAAALPQHTPVKAYALAGTLDTPGNADSEGLSAPAPTTTTPPAQENAQHDGRTPTPLTAPVHEGYLGATSYKHAMDEARSNIPLSSSADNISTGAMTAEVKASQSPIMYNARTYEAAMRVLRAIPPKALAYDFSNANVNPNDAWCRLATLQLHDSFWDTFGKYLEGHRSAESLVQLATKISENSAKPLREDCFDPKEWFQSFSGGNMRWEGLGLLFVHWSFGITEFRRDPASLSRKGQDYADYVVKYRDCSWDIVEITRSTASANTLMLSLVYSQECLESIVSGDESMQNSRLHGETMSMVTYLGFHAIKGQVHDRGVCTQIKRRLFGKIFHGDKVLSMYAGRPPMLSRRFVSTPLPLDIPDEVLMGVIPWENGIVDAQGWNTLGKIYPSTLLRARAYMGYMRDSILDFNLQVGGDVARNDLLNLRTQQEEVVAKFPEFLVFKLEDVEDRAISGPTLYSKLLIELERLQNNFLIERLLCAAESTKPSLGLLQVSIRLLSTTLIFWTHKDRMISKYNLEWIVMGYAAPAAGVLCSDLLRPRGESAALASGTSRSEVVQMLCLLCGFLDWIKPLAPNRDLNTSVRRVIQRVLDETLNSSASAQQPVVETMDWGAEMEINMNDFGFDLLGTFDWMLPEAFQVPR